MSRPFYEVAAEITNEVIKAKAAIISNLAVSLDTKKDLIEEYLGNEAIGDTYKAIQKSLQEA